MTQTGSQPSRPRPAAPAGSILERSGVVVVDKPKGMTSHDVVARLRRIMGTRRVGHSGTLDPLATGVLVVGVERGTKFLAHVVAHDKRYRATVRFGASTLTDDSEGRVVSVATPEAVRAVTVPEVHAALQWQCGEILQRPSSVSAVKISGRRAHELVREGIDVVLPARPVTVHSLVVSDVRFVEAAVARDTGTGHASADSPAASTPAVSDAAASDPATPADPASTSGHGRSARPDGSSPAAGSSDSEERPDELPGPWWEADIDVHCSSGTFIRAIARDAGIVLGIGGHVTALRRLSAGPFEIAEARTLEDLQRSPGLTLTLDAAMARCFPVRTVTDAEAELLAAGRWLDPAGATGVRAAIAPDGRAMALVEEAGKRARCVFVARPQGMA